MENSMPLSEDKIYLVNDNGSSQQLENAVRSIVKNYEQDYDAFYVFAMKDVIDRVVRVQQTLSRAEISYLVKCNNEAFLLKLLASLNCNFSCVSKPEIAKVHSICQNPDKIYFINPMKPVSHIRHALESRVSNIVFETEDELMKFDKLKIGNPDLIFNMGGMGTSKFGNNSIKDAPRIFSLAKDLNLNVTGISITLENDEFETKLKEAQSVIQEAANVGFTINLLYINGALLNMEPFHSTLNAALNTHFPDQGLKIVCELGKFLVQSAFTLACKILGKKYVDAGEILKNDRIGIYSTDQGVFYYIYEGIYTSFTISMFKQPDSVPQPLKMYPKGELLPSTIWGCTCDSFDKVYNCVYLPDMEMNDWVKFPNMGSFTFCATSDFNGFPVTKVIKILDYSSYEYLNKNKMKILFEENVFELGSKLK